MKVEWLERNGAHLWRCHPSDEAYEAYIRVSLSVDDIHGHEASRLGRWKFIFLKELREKLDELFRKDLA